MEQELEPRVKEGIDVIAKYFEEDKFPCEITLDLPSLLFKAYSIVCSSEYISPDEFMSYILKKDTLDNNLENSIAIVLFSIIKYSMLNNKQDKNEHIQ